MIKSITGRTILSIEPVSERSKNVMTIREGNDQNGQPYITIDGSVSFEAIEAVIETLIGLLADGKASIGGGRP